MSRKIATLPAVFAACNRLEAAGAPWNRDDVREAVGGGGWTVIDPLIHAWRDLKPVMELAPSTPALLLHHIAQTLEAHFSEFMGEVERRERERRQVFERTGAELSENMAALEKDLQEKERALETWEGKCQRLADQLDEKSKTLQDKSHQLSNLQAENDTLRGQHSRLEKQAQETFQQHQQTIHNLEAKFEQTVSTLTQAHKTELDKQKRELIQAHDQSENRLMRLLDRERTDGKKQAEQLTQQWAESRQKEQAAREQAIEQQNRLQRLQDKVDDLDNINRQLREDLAADQASHRALLAEYQTFRTAQDGRFGDLQSALLNLKQKIGN